MEFGRNKQRIVEGTEEMIQQERLEMMNSRITSMYYSSDCWSYFGGY